MTSTFTTPDFDDQRSLPHHQRASMNFRHSQSGRPSTPSHQLRSNNSSFASTSSGSSFRGEEDAIVFEFGARWLRAGFEGDSAPMCVVGCGPDDCRRAGDYRGWVKGSQSSAEGSQAQGLSAEEWTGRYELWKMDLRDVDLGLVEDKMERMFRETYNKYLLTDAGTSRLVLVLPSVMPHPLMSSILSTLFGRWRFPSITLLQSPVMTATAAGVRSALVVDLGWGETVVSGVYEYREVTTRRSTRAMKALLQETGRAMTRLSSSAGETADEISVDFEYCEELVSRFAWCKPRVAKESIQEGGATPTGKKLVSIPSPSNPSSGYIDVAFGTFAEPVEKVLFAEDMADCDLDDEEKPVPLLVYNALLDLPPDARGTCMSRIVFVGGGSHIPGIRRRVLDEVAFLVERYGWCPVRGRVIEQQREKLQNMRLSQQPSSPTGDRMDSSEAQAQENQTPRQDQTEEPETEEEIDHIEQKIRRNNKDKDTKPQIHGVLREVESLGPWAGASLVSSLKVRGLVEIEREKYLQQGLSGASRDLESHGHVADRRSGLRSGGDRSSWTLAGWG